MQCSHSPCEYLFSILLSLSISLSLDSSWDGSFDCWVLHILRRCVFTSNYLDQQAGGLPVCLSEICARGGSNNVIIGGHMFVMSSLAGVMFVHDL